MRYNPGMSTEPFRRILVICTRQIGDVLLTTPLIDAAKRRWPEASVDVLGFVGTLGILRGNPQIDRQTLEQLLGEIDTVSGQLLAQAGKSGTHLRENEWLMAIKQRTGIPGGVCEFDLPAYHYWLHQDGAARRNRDQVPVALTVDHGRAKIDIGPRGGSGPLHGLRSRA